MPTLIKITDTKHAFHEHQFLAEEIVAMHFVGGEPNTVPSGDDDPESVYMHVTLRNNHDVYMAWPWAERDKALEAKAEVERLWAVARGDIECQP